MKYLEIVPLKSIEHLGDSQGSLFKLIPTECGNKFILGTEYLEVVEALADIARLLGRRKTDRRKPSKKPWDLFPIGSMYGIYTYIYIYLYLP